MTNNTIYQKCKDVGVFAAQTDQEYSADSEWCEMLARELYKEACDEQAGIAPCELEYWLVLEDLLCALCPFISFVKERNNLRRMFQ